MQKELDNNVNNELLKLIHVSKIYAGGYTGLLDINFSMRNGEKIVFIGDKAAGKTTLLSLIAGLESLDSGKIYFNNQDISTLKIKDRNLGYVACDLQLNERKSVKDNICYPLKIRKFSANEIEENFALICNECNLARVMSCKVKKLSQFERVLTAIARLAMLERNLYLIDNIFEGLTVTEKELLAQIINKLFGNKNLIVCVDDIEIAEKLKADKLGILAYSTLTGFDKFYNKEIFKNTLAGAKLIDNNKCACIPCEILNDGNIIVGDEKFVFNKKIKSSVFDKGILFTSINNINLNKNAVFTAKIEYITQNKIAYLDFYGSLMTMYIGDCAYEISEELQFDFDVNKCELYDFGSERKISA